MYSSSRRYSRAEKMTSLWSLGGRRRSTSCRLEWLSYRYRNDDGENDDGYECDDEADDDDNYKCDDEGDDDGDGDDDCDDNYDIEYEFNS